RYCLTRCGTRLQTPCVVFNAVQAACSQPAGPGDGSPIRSVRRLYCRNAACSRRTFVERLPGLIAPRAQRADRLATAQGRVGVLLGGEAGARMLRQIGMPTSGDTVLRLVRRLPLPRRPAPRVLGVDDWARRKGR